MPKKDKIEFTDSRALELTDEFIANSRKDTLIASWEKTEYFLNGEMLLYQDRSGHWRPIRPGMDLGNGLVISADSVLNYPKDPHILTLANGLMAKALGNPLIPQALPFSSDEADKEAAKKVTNFLLAHRAEVNEDRQAAGTSMREEVIDWLFVTGNAFIKDYFDPNAGEAVPGLPEDEQLYRGKIRSEVIPPQCMLVPNGIAKMDDLPWIGEQRALSVDYIYETYGVKVDAEENLEDVRRTTNYGTSNLKGDDNRLKNHAVVYEFYIRPSAENDYQGRKIVRTKDKILYNGVYDAKLMAHPEYRETDWHPYSHAGWRRCPGKFWRKSMFEELISLQIKLNAQWKRLLENDDDLRGWWVSQEGSVDWEKVRTSAEDDGFPNIQYMRGYEKPFFQPPPPINQDALGKIQGIVARMNDLVAQYETTRGNSDPNITSGRQADVMNQSSNTQATPILTAIVSLFMAHWRKVVHLAAVHFEPSGREIRFYDPISQDKDWQIDTFKPSDVRCDDIVLYGGNAFYQSPEARKQELMQMAEMGYFGDVKGNPADRKAFLRLYDAPTADSLYSDELVDIEAAKRENKMFSQFQFIENRSWILEPIIIAYQQAVAAWMQAKMAFEQAMPQYQAKLAEFERLYPIWERAEREYQLVLEKGQPVPDPGPPPEHPGEPPIDPGPMPEQPHPYWRAQYFEDHQSHIKIHREWRKSSEYERLCRANPELDKAMDSHEQSHLELLVAEAQKQLEIQQQIARPEAPVHPPAGAVSIAPGPPPPGEQAAGQV